MNTDSEQIERLRIAVEQTTGCQMQMHKDFVFLSESIFEQTHQTIGVNTLKRLWGSIENGATPRLSTLTILAQYVGFKDWDDFCINNQNKKQSEQRQLERSESPSSSRNPYLVIALAVIIVSLIGGTGMYVNSVRQKVSLLQDSLLTVQSDKYTLHHGQTFSSFDEYLNLFGLTDVKDYPYFQVHPRYSWLVLWGPAYHHPHWFNDGDTAQHLPTITERWAPADANADLIALRNSELFYNGRRNNDIRLTFMKGLRPDSLFTFIGVYRFSLSQSDTAHIVWEKVADDCDLQHLELLERLRN